MNARNTEPFEAIEAIESLEDWMQHATISDALASITTYQNTLRIQVGLLMQSWAVLKDSKDVLGVLASQGVEFSPVVIERLEAIDGELTQWMKGVK